jgi:hypothetical protein
VENLYMSKSNLIAHKVEINLNMHCALVLDGVAGHVDGADVVAENLARRRGAWSSRRSWRSQEASAIALATAQYSASALERETFAWHLED